MRISIQTVIKKGHISGQRQGHNLLKTVLLKLNFQEELHLFATFLFYILSLFLKCLLSQFFTRGIRMHIFILKGAQKALISG